jgi:ATP/maltotriose-dependent transcriptional regulator MalT
MTALDEAVAVPIDQTAGTAADWSELPMLAISRSGAPPSVATREIRRAIVQARSALAALRLDEASRALNHLSLLLSARGHSKPIRFGFALRILQACLLVAGDQCAEARHLLATLPSAPREAIATTLLRYLNWKCGEHGQGILPDTVDYLTPAVGGKAIERILSFCVGAVLAFDRLQLTVSAALATEALQLARDRYGNHSPISSIPAILLAQVAYEQGRLDEAEALLRPRMPVIRASGIPECVVRASLLLARLSLHRGHHRAALATLREAEVIGRARRWPRLVSAAAMEHSRTLSIIRYHERRSSETRAVGGSGIFARSFHTPARTAMTSGLTLTPIGASIDTRWQNEAVTYSALENVLKNARPGASDGYLDESCCVLIPCLRLGAARGLQMIFIDAGATILASLERLYSTAPMHDSPLCDLRPYIATLLRSASPPLAEEPATLAYRPLSRRETGILQMIAHGHSNKHIAQSLGIAPETVKSHAKSIFVKLATRTRAQAVARAEAIGLL